MRPNSRRHSCVGRNVEIEPRSERQLIGEQVWSIGDLVEPFRHSVTVLRLKSRPLFALQREERERVAFVRSSSVLLERIRIGQVRRLLYVFEFGIARFRDVRNLFVHALARRRTVCGTGPARPLPEAVELNQWDVWLWRGAGLPNRMHRCLSMPLRTGGDRHPEQQLIWRNVVGRDHPSA